MLKNAKIRTKLGVGFGTILVIMLAMSIYAIISFLTVYSDVSFAFDYELTKVDLLNNLWDAIDIMKLNVEDILKTTNADTIATLKQGIYDAIAQSDSLYESIEPLVAEGIDRATYNEVIVLRTEFRRTMNVVLDYLDKNDYASLRGFFFQFTDSESQYIEKVNELFYLYIENMINTGIKLKANAVSSITTLIITVILGFLIALILAYIITRMITKPLSKCVDAANSIANGVTDINIDITGHDELAMLADAMDDMIKSLKQLYEDAVFLSKEAVAGKLDSKIDLNKHKGDFAKIIKGMNDTMEAVVTPITEAMQVMEKLANKDLTYRIRGSYQGEFNDFKEDVNRAIVNLDNSLTQVRLSVEQISQASNLINQGSQKLADTTSAQASSIEQISTSLEEVNSITANNSDQAKDGLKLADHAMRSVDQAALAMDQMNKAMDSILASARETSAIIKTIDEIAFQTNLLALNAAVEAAHAGEVGKGFAVVADEVKNLSTRSAEAARNTDVLIEESGKKSEQGSQIVETVTKSFNVMKDEFNNVKKIVTEIVASSQEQTQSISQITIGINEVTRSTQQNASNAESSAATADELHNQADELKDMVEQYVLSKQKM